MPGQLYFCGQNELLKQSSFAIIELLNSAQYKSSENIVLVSTNRPSLVAVGSDRAAQSSATRRMNSIRHKFLRPSDMTLPK
jgi:hypothetical protein